MAIAVSIEGFEPDQKRVYKTVGDKQYDLHIFYPEGHKPTDKSPAIVFFFGGGWKGGSPSQFFPHCEYLASRGMVAIAAEYRVNSRDGTTPRESVTDGKSAIRWVRQHAAELGVDPDRIVAGGGSAGGQVAAAAGTTTDFDDPAEDLAVSSRPAALVLFNPVYDNSAEGYGYERVSEYWEAFSPMHNLSEATPPTIVFLGTEDKLIPVSTAKKFQRLMAEKGVRSELYLYEGMPHGFFNYDRNPAIYRDTAVKMDRFLASLGYLEGEPSLAPEPKVRVEQVEVAQ